MARPFLPSSTSSFTFRAECRFPSFALQASPSYERAKQKLRAHYVGFMRSGNTLVDHYKGTRCIFLGVEKAQFYVPGAVYAESGYELASLLKGLISGSGKDSFLCRLRCQQRWDCLNAHTSLVHLNRGWSWRYVPSSIKVQQSDDSRIVGAVNDLRYAWRMLVRSPGFTIATVALLSAGIGTSVVILSALGAVCANAAGEASKRNGSRGRL